MGKEVIKLEYKFPELIKTKKTRVAAYARASTDREEQATSNKL